MPAWVRKPSAKGPHIFSSPDIPGDDGTCGLQANGSGVFVKGTVKGATGFDSVVMLRGEAGREQFEHHVNQFEQKEMPTQLATTSHSQPEKTATRGKESVAHPIKQSVPGWGVGVS